MTTPAGQRWTHRKPAREGWYWWREDPDSTPQMLYVKQLNVGLRVMIHADQSATMEYLQGEWQGPIIPHEATE